MKKMTKINLLKKADVLNEKEMKLLIGGERDTCGGDGYHLYSCAWGGSGYSPTHAWVCATNLNDAWSKLEETIYNQLNIKISGACADYN